MKDLKVIVKEIKGYCDTMQERDLKMTLKILKIKIFLNQKVVGVETSYVASFLLRIALFLEINVYQIVLLGHVW